MTLPKYTVPERLALAQKLDVSEQSLYQWLTSIKPPSAAMAVRLNKADKRIRLEDLRPSDYAAIWPDYARKLAKESKA